MTSANNQRRIQKRVGFALSIAGAAVVVLNLARLAAPDLPSSIATANIFNAVTVGALALAALVTAFIDSRVVRICQAAVFWIGAGIGLLVNDPLNVVGMVFVVLAFSLTAKYGFIERHRRLKLWLSLGAVAVVFTISSFIHNNASLVIVLALTIFTAFVMLILWVIFEEEIQAYMARTAGLERDLTERERRYELAVRAGRVGVWDRDLLNGGIYVDPILKGMLGYADGEIGDTAQDWGRLIHPEDAAAVEAGLRDHVEGRTPQYEAEHRMVHRDGGTRWFFTRGTVMRDKAGKAVRLTGTHTDVTQRKELEMRLVRTERLRALGEMSASISHNLNNILTSILGPALLIRERGNADPATLEDTDMIVSSATRARDLVTRLSMALRDARPRVQAVSLNNVIREAVIASRNRWKDEAEGRGAVIDVVMVLAEIGTVAATEAETHEMLMNLILNAVDAMPQGGTISIETCRVGAMARLKVRDNGSGMDEATRRRVFEPFFTTKADVGTGLGLATVYGSVNRWGGTIEVRSAPGKGSTFVIDLPLWEGRADAGSPAAAAPAEDHRRGRILVVDDERAVSHLLSQILSPVHEVTIASASREALELLDRGRFEVAIVDLGLPDIPGDELSRQIRRKSPRTVTVMITGWTLGPDDPRLSAFSLALFKPFAGPREVRDAVVRALEIYDQGQPSTPAAQLLP